jgi:hypothetical protein
MLMPSRKINTIRRHNAELLNVKAYGAYSYHFGSKVKPDLTHTPALKLCGMKIHMEVDTQML